MSGDPQQDPAPPAPDGEAGFAVLPGAVIARLEAEDDAAVLRALSARLRAQGHVTDSFEAAVLAREEAYPTGLPTTIPSAIPHTDPEHVLTPGLAVATLAAPVAFREMGSVDRRVDAEVVVMLVLRDAHSQLAALQLLMARLQDEGAVREVLVAADDAELDRRARAWLAP